MTDELCPRCGAATEDDTAARETFRHCTLCPWWRRVGRQRTPRPGTDIQPPEPPAVHQTPVAPDDTVTVCPKCGKPVRKLAWHEHEICQARQHANRTSQVDAA